jgi:hypothetical protein
MRALAGGLGDPAVGNGLLVMFVKNKRALEVVTGERGHTKSESIYSVRLVSESSCPAVRLSGCVWLLARLLTSVAV